MSNNRMFGYVRVSSKDQNLDRQINALIEYGVDRRDITEDKISGKNFNREGYQLLKNRLLRHGDTLVIKELDRLGRDMEQIKVEWNELQSQGIEIVVIDTPILNTANKSDIEKKLISNIVFELLSYMAHKERDKIRQRQAEGIEQARKKGKHLGRPKSAYPINWDSVYKAWKEKEITAKLAMDQLGMKRTTFYKLVKEYELDQKLKS